MPVGAATGTALLVALDMLLDSCVFKLPFGMYVAGMRPQQPRQTKSEHCDLTRAQSANGDA